MSSAEPAARAERRRGPVRPAQQCGKRAGPLRRAQQVRVAGQPWMPSSRTSSEESGAAPSGWPSKCG